MSDSILFAQYASMGNMQQVKEFVENGGDINTNEDGRTALYFAAANGHVDIVRFLLENGADPNMQDSFSKTTPLFIAVQRQVSNEIIELLLVNGADPNICELYGDTSLQFALNCNNKAAAEIIRKYGGR